MHYHACTTCPPPDTGRGEIAKRGRKLLRAGKITHRELVILDCLLWSCRDPLTGAIVVSYTALCRLAHVGRETVAGAVARLQRLGVLTRIKRRVRVLWHQGGQQSRQAANAYVLHPPHSEFAGRTVVQSDREIYHVIEAPAAAVRAAQEALARVRAARSAALGLA